MEQVPNFALVRVVNPDDPDKRVTTTTDGSKERLDVSANISSGNPPMLPEPIHQYDGWDSDTTKISYTVPANKVLHIQSLWCAHLTDAAGHIIAFRVGTTQFCWMSFNNDGTTTFQKDYPERNPYGPISAGSVVTAYLVDGSTSEEWGAGFDGYLEDA